MLIAKQALCQYEWDMGGEKKKAKNFIVLQRLFIHSEKSPGNATSISNSVLYGFSCLPSSNFSNESSHFFLNEIVQKLRC